MTPTAVHTPFRENDAERVGKTLFRKQVLPIGSVEHEGRTLEFTAERLAGMAKNFSSGALDQVPFVLVDEKNEHSDDPERYRGEVKGLEAGDDGLYALIEMSDEGAKLIEKNPKLGVSARIIEGLEKAGEKVGDVIAHVAGTLNPVAKGMQPWETVELSHPEYKLISLTDAQYSDEVELSESDRSTLKDLLKRVTGRKDGKDDETVELSEERANEIVDSLLEESKTETETETTVELSEEDEQRLELAEKAAKDARSEAEKARRELSESRFETEKAALIHDGVPPALVDLCAPILKGADSMIELSATESIDAKATVRKILDEAKGTIDFSELGRQPLGDRDEETQSQLDTWERQNPEGVKTGSES